MTQNSATQNLGANSLQECPGTQLHHMALSIMILKWKAPQTHLIHKLKISSSPQFHPQLLSPHSTPLHSAGLKWVWGTSPGSNTGTERSDPAHLAACASEASALTCCAR